MLYNSAWVLSTSIPDFGSIFNANRIYLFKYLANKSESLSLTKSLKNFKKKFISVLGLGKIFLFTYLRTYLVLWNSTDFSKDNCNFSLSFILFNNTGNLSIACVAIIDDVLSTSNSINSSILSQILSKTGSISFVFLYNKRMFLKNENTWGFLKGSWR